MSNPSVSIVIPAYSRSARNAVREASVDQVRAAVLSVSGQDLDSKECELIVVHGFDEAPMARLAAEVQALTPCDLRVCRVAAPGPAAARDAGARQARGEVIAFLDSDHRAAPGWLRAGLSAFDDRVGIVQGRTVPEPGRSLGPLTRYVRRDAENIYYETSNIFYRRAAFEEAGGFADAAAPPKEWQRRAEAVLLAWRIKRCAWRSVFEPGALAHSDVTPLPLRHWLFDNGLYRLPWVIRRLPELRAFFCARYFFDAPQAGLLLALLGAPIAWFTPAATVLFAPYFITRACEPTKTLSGALRLVRPLLFLPRDIISFILLLAGSIRYRTVFL